MNTKSPSDSAVSAPAQNSDHPSFLSPYTGEPLLRQGEYLYSDGHRLYPFVDEILFLRKNERLRTAAVAALQAHDVDRARTMLLRSQDRFAPVGPPSRRAIHRLLNDRTLNLRQAMDLLNYGPVADYFAYRWGMPTHLSGLSLLRHGVHADRPVVEIACGIGHYLRTLETNGIRTVGVDIVFSKLWLARWFMDVQGPLVCGDIEDSALVRMSGPTTVFCHDAYYFFEHKKEALDHMRQIAQSGNVLLGHVHTNAVDHGVAGFPESAEAYRKRASQTAIFVDDNDLVDQWLHQQPIVQQSRNPDTAPALGWLEGNLPEQPFAMNRHSGSLRPHPLLRNGRPQWPSEGFQKEYEADAAYFSATAPATEQDRFRFGHLVDLPERW